MRFNINYCICSTQFNINYCIYSILSWFLFTTMYAVVCEWLSIGMLMGLLLTLCLSRPLPSRSRSLKPLMGEEEKFQPSVYIKSWALVGTVSSFFKLIFTKTWRKVGILEKSMRLFSIKSIKIFKNFAVEVFWGWIFLDWLVLKLSFCISRLRLGRYSPSLSVMIIRHQCYRWSSVSHECNSSWVLTAVWTSSSAVTRAISKHFIVTGSEC
jgi:hypothetical protein